MPVEEVAEQVNEWEWNSETGSTPDEREKTILTLEHTHLPKIADAAQVEYNRENDQVQITGMSAEMDVLLSVSEAIEQPSRSGGIVFDCDF